MEELSARGLPQLSLRHPVEGLWSKTSSASFLVLHFYTIIIHKKRPLSTSIQCLTLLPTNTSSAMALSLCLTTQTRFQTALWHFLSAELFPTSSTLSLTKPPFKSSTTTPSRLKMPCALIQRSSLSSLPSKFIPRHALLHTSTP